MEVILGLLLVMFAVGAVWFIYDAAARKENNGRCSACIQDGMCFCKED